MNKILMDGKDIKIDHELNIDGKHELNIINISDDLDLIINMNDNSELLILDFDLSDRLTKLIINQTNNTVVNYVHSFKIKNNYNLTYYANIKGNNNINNINIKGITEGIVNLDIDGNVLKNTKDNVLNENVKILNVNGKVITKPMLHISTLDVLANHNTAISNIREQELFYLNSKGISKSGAINLIQDGYLYGLFKKYPEFYELINRR